MIFKIRTSKKTMSYFDEIGGSENLQPFILSKLAIAMSIKSETPLSESDYNSDNLGLELNRQQITGEYDDFFKGLIEIHEMRHLEDDEYFQKHLKAHLDRGASMIYSEFRYNSDFILGLLDTKLKL